MTLTPAALDGYARDYYLSDQIEDIDIEERAQRLNEERPFQRQETSCPTGDGIG